ncbi:MAG: hypothetical protein WDN44_15840 [Sphingomonas sp.]
MNMLDTALARIETQLDKSLLPLEQNGTSSAEADAFEAFLARPSTLERESLIVRCRFDGESFDVSTVVDKAYSRRRVRDGLLPCLERIKARLSGRFDVFVLISDMVYVNAAARAEFVDFLRHVPFLRCDWLEGDPISSGALVIPDLWLQESGYGDEVIEIDRAAARLPFERRQEIIKWRGGPQRTRLSRSGQLSRFSKIPTAPAGASPPECHRCAPHTL